MEVAQSVKTAGKAVPAISQVVPELPEGDGAHREINAAAAHDQKPEQRPGQTTEQRAGQHRKRRRMHEITQCQPGAVSAKAEIGRMAEAQYTGEAQQQIEPHGGKAKNQDAAGK